MSISPISAEMRRAEIARARGRCEYCGVPSGATLAPHEPDHIIGEQHGGTTALDNLALACFRCNRLKGPNIATKDPDTGQLVPLYNPRTDRWSEHFRMDGALIEGVTSVGRGTAAILRFNDEQRVGLRLRLVESGEYSPPQS